MRVITVANQKGGVGKTTTSLALCAGFAKKGYRVLGIDLDPQGNFSGTTNVQNDENVHTAYSVLKKSCTLPEAIQHSDDFGFDVVPCGKALMFLADELNSHMDRYVRLKEQLDAMGDSYDYVFIDVPPSLGIFTLNAMTASNEIIIPSVADNFSLEGIIELYRSVMGVRKYNGNPDLKVLGIVLTMYDARPLIVQAATKYAVEISKAIDVPLFETRIRVNSTVKSAQTFHKSVFDYKKDCNAAIDYMALVDEIIAMEKKNDKAEKVRRKENA